MNDPVKNFVRNNDAETIFNRLDVHGKTWKVYIGEPMRLSATGLVHFSRLQDRFATHFVPFAEFETDAANGNLPDFSFIEPALGVGHNDYHPACGRALGHGIAVAGLDPPSSILGGEAFLSRIYRAYQGMQSPTGSNVWNTTLLIGWDEPGGTYDHVPPPPVPPPDPSAPASQHGFTFDRSGYRVPAIIVSPWVAESAVFNEEHCHTSLIATLRAQWNLGDPFTARDAAARTFSDVFTLDTPRDLHTWPDPEPRPVPEFIEDAVALGTTISPLGKTLFQGVREYADQHHIEIEGLPKDPNTDVPPDQMLIVFRNFLATIFPLLAPADPAGGAITRADLTQDGSGLGELSTTAAFGPPSARSIAYQLTDHPPGPGLPSAAPHNHLTGTVGLVLVGSRVTWRAFADARHWAAQLLHLTRR